MEYNILSYQTKCEIIKTIKQKLTFKYCLND